MDNATRFLIMAGGILIAMLVIAISMFMLTSFRSAYDKNAELRLQYEKDLFNSNFNIYSQTIMGSDAYNILSKVDEINNDSNSLIDRVASLGDITVDNYTSYFYFTERLREKFDYVYTFNGAGIINSVTIMKH